MEEQTKILIIERVQNAKTKAELASVKATIASAFLQKESEEIVKIRDEKNEKMAFLNAVTAKRHDEISEENRQQWKRDRTEMWDEAANTCTPQTIAAILHAAKKRGVIGSYSVEFANGAIIDSKGLLESEAQQ